PGDVINETGIFTGIAPNDYIVNVTDENSCGPIASNTITVGFPDAIDDISKSDLVKLYPNPTSDKLNIEIDIEEAGSCKIEILTISGQVVFQKEVEFSGKLIDELDLSMYSKGIYIIRVTGNAIYYKEKILLQ
ncbi:MAG: T9SS type A sorting domain-containing protein, partial [Bacteroidales bacterium]|nr:T9SS type A sorting domain-containing protein [Bacteroidales bacterium]